MIQSFKDMATRLVNADASGAATLAQLGGIDDAAARKAWDVFVHLGLARSDAVTGQAEFRHGAALAPDVIGRAADQHATLMATRPTYWRRKRR